MRQQNIDRESILVILPAYNEGKVIGTVLQSVKNEGYHNICVIDDGSTDQTSQIAQNAGVFVLRHLINRGAGAAIQTGLSYAKKEGYPYAVLMDSDGQHFPSDIAHLSEKIVRSQADIVIGNRFMRSKTSIPTHRIIYNNIADLYTNIFCKKNYSDTQSGFRLLNRRAIELLQLKNRDFAFCSEMIFYAEKNKLRIEECPIQVKYTTYSLNKGQNLREGIRTARSILWRVIFD